MSKTDTHSCPTGTTSTIALEILMSSRDVLKIFWPSHICAPHTSAGFLIGWYTASSTICVAALISDVELEQLRLLLADFCLSGDHSEFEHINKVCKAPPKILGVLENQATIPADDRNELEPWLSVVLNDAYVPILLSPEKCDYEIIFYEQPNPKRLQFLALDPLQLDISSKPSEPTTDQAVLANLQIMIDYGHRMMGQASRSDDLSAVLVQINSSYYLEKGIKASHSNREQHMLAPIMSGARRICDRAMQVFVPARWVLKKLFLGPCICLIFMILWVVELTLHMLSMRLPKLMLNAVALKDLSTAGQQVDLRLQQLYFWPRQYALLWKKNRANTAETRAHYISFYNNMWLIANDIIIGLAVGSFLMSNHLNVALILNKVLYKCTVESLESMMLWFLETPAGLKLNRELASFLSELFLWLIRLWTGCVQAIQPFTPQIIHMIGVSGMFGVSMIISLSSDFLAFMTLHVYCFYMVAARIFNWQLVILFSLFNLFRGKKRNILRNRIDSCDYDLDQLLLGTCLFTLLTFLFPTVIVYYLTFALGRVGVIFLQAIMETLLAFFNHFPLFAIMLRFKDPDRLPGGLHFKMFSHDDFLLTHHYYRHHLQRLRARLRQLWKDKAARTRRKSVRFRIPALLPARDINGSPSSADSGRNGAYLWMRNMPIPFSAIFFQYMLLWKRLSAHYFSAYVLRCLLYGEPIKPIPKLQYPMLPEKRPSLETAWKVLKSNLWDA
ncbi:phosphatidylinositol N-acetylglucosaminyltransferase subunit gpi1 [Apophysomyces sp. BC1015]|nr:phosphatidylinositol N-acetylglucosaminyltransferase subunit gpi1 [Apophysomyces sp. BC1015]